MNLRMTSIFSMLFGLVALPLQTGAIEILSHQRVPGTLDLQITF